jgi:hypothetical protein
VIVWNLHKGKNQQWDIVYADLPEPAIKFKPGKPFVLINQMAGKRLLTLNGSNFEVRSNNHSPEQLFMFDEATQTIRLFANQQFSIAIEDHGRSRNLNGHKTDGAWYQRWTWEGNMMKNERGLVMDVSGAKDVDGQNVIVWKAHGKQNQQWLVEYVDADTIQNGMIPDKPFRIISLMKSGRAITRSKDQVVIQDMNANNKDQVFVFDSQTGSIQPKRDHNVAMEIGEEGRNRYARFAKEKDIWYQHFQIKGEYIMNERGLVLDVAGGRDLNNQNVLTWKKHKGLNQKWKIDYV